MYNQFGIKEEEIIKSKKKEDKEKEIEKWKH